MNLEDYLVEKNIEFTKTEKGLKVGGSLYLSNTKITKLPKGLEVGGETIGFDN